jgi:O-antigen/teichoic acid export membrane protein
VKPEDRTRSMLANSAVFVLAQFSGILVSLILTPYIISTLGIEQFGLWSFIAAIVAWAGPLQFGVGKGTIRFISHYAELGQIQVARRIVSYGVFAHIAFGLILTPLAWVFASWLVPHLSISSSLEATAVGLFTMVFGYLFFAGAVRPLAALVIGLERMWQTSIATVASQLFYGGLTVVLLSQGAGLYGLAGAAFGQAVFQGVAYYMAGRRLIGRVFGNPFALDRGIVRQLLKFGGWLQLGGAAGLVNNQTDAILVGAFVDVRTVGFYAIGNKIAQLVRIFASALLPPLLPAATGIHAQGDEKRLERTLRQSSRLVGLMTIGMSGFILATTQLIMEVWLGRSYPHVVVVTALMLVAYGFYNLGAVGMTIAQAMGQARLGTEFPVVAAVLNIVITLALAPVFGLYGIVAGTAVGMMIATSWFLWRFYRFARLPLRDQLIDWLWRATVAATLAGGVVFALRTWMSDSIHVGRLGSAIELLLLAVVYVALLLYGLRVFRFLEARDLATVRNVLPTRFKPLAETRGIEHLFRART